MKKKLLVLTMSTLFATQFINSNYAKASVTESVNKNFVVSEDKLNKISDPSAASKIVDKNFVVPESKFDKIVPSYKEKDNRINVPAITNASQRVDSNFVVKGPEVNRFITQNKVNHHFITTQTHYKKVITSYKSTHVHKHINHATTSINNHFTVKPSEAPKYTQPSHSQTLIVNKHFVVPGSHSHHFVQPGHASIKINHFCVVPQINSFKVIPPYGHSSHRMHIPSFQKNTTSVHQNSEVNKAYNYNCLCTYMFVKNLNSQFSFSQPNGYKIGKPSLNIKNVNYQYAVPSNSPTHYVPEFKGSLPATRV
ncbi:TPA: extracellular matrix protein-binding adhesin Emp [Staphylococcus aureus]